MIIAFVIGFFIFLISMAVHEAAHGYVAYICGDRTAEEAGRLTLNPIKHIDPVWTVIVPIALVVLHSPILFGMAKPVPVNFMRLRHPKRDMIFVAAAGPLSNLCMAVLMIHLFKMTGMTVFMYMIFLNLALGFFNLLPIPPLDGGRILAGLLPNHLAYRFGKIEPYGIMIVILLIMTGIARQIFEFCLAGFMRFFG